MKTDGVLIMKEKNEATKRKRQRKDEVVKWYRFFNKWTWFGVILLLISVIIKLSFGETIIFVILSQLFQTVGIALIVGAVFDFSKNSLEFTDFISSLLSDIVISKTFLKKLSSGDKEEALKLILQPSENQLEQYSNINEYFKKQINRSTQMFDTNFKSNVVINLESYKENDKVITRGKISYRIYKVGNKFDPIIVKFEREDSNVEEKRIIYPGGVLKIKDEDFVADNKEEAGIQYKEYVYSIPADFNEFPYLTIESEIIEYGFDHWTNFHWTSLTPYDGVTFSLKCRNNLIIKEIIVFDEKDPYFVNMSSDKKEIAIISTEWLNAYTGFSLTIGESE